MTDPGITRLESHVRLRVEGQIAELTIDRPEKRNALTPGMLTELCRLAEEAGNSSRAVVVAGAGATFCSGFDLSLCVAEPDGTVMRQLLKGLSAFVRTLRGLPVPVVIAAHGAALAGGCAILGGGDVVITDAKAKLGYPVVRIGVSPAVSAPFLAGMVGLGRTRVRQVDPGLISGAEAVRQGLAHEAVAEPDQVLPRALRVAADLAAKPTGTMHATKAWLLSLDEESCLAEGGLEASLALTGGAEERELLPRALTPPPKRAE